MGASWSLPLVMMSRTWRLLVVPNSLEIRQAAVKRSKVDTFVLVKL